VLCTVLKIGVSLTDLKSADNVSEYAEKNPKETGIRSENLQNIPRTAYTEYIGLIFLK
jgi:hypothetical protein